MRPQHSACNGEVFRTVGLVVRILDKQSVLAKHQRIVHIRIGIMPLWTIQGMSDQQVLVYKNGQGVEISLSCWELLLQVFPRQIHCCQYFGCNIFTRSVDVGKKYVSDNE